MKTKIYYEIKKDDAIKAGKNQWGEFFVELDPVEIPEDVREEVALRADVNSDSKDKRIYVAGESYYVDDLCHGIDVAEPITVEQALDLLREKTRNRLASVEKHRQKEEDRRKRLFDRERENWEKNGTVGVYFLEAEKNLPEDIQKIISLYKAKKEQLECEARVRDEEYNRKEGIEREKREAKKCEQEAAEEERKQRRLQIRDEILQLAISRNPEIQERYDAKLLPTTEATQIVNDYLFADFSEFSRYTKIRPSDIDHTGEYCEGSISFNCDNPTDGVSAKIFQVKKQIEAQCKNRRLAEYDLEYKSEIQQHIAACDDCKATIIKFSLRVAVSVDNLKIASRLFALED